MSITMIEEVSFIPEGNENRPGDLITPQFITIHTTGNHNYGADAIMHRDFVHKGGGEYGVSFHYVIDDDRAIQLLPLTELAYHAKAEGNVKSIGIELCVNLDNDFEQTLRNAILVVRAIYQTLNLTTNIHDSVVMHNWWTQTSCPVELRADGERLWKYFKNSLVPIPNDDNHDMEKYYQLHKDRLGEKHYAGYCNTHYYKGPILRCDTGVVIPGQKELASFMVDDWETYNSQHITKYLG